MVEDSRYLSFHDNESVVSFVTSHKSTEETSVAHGTYLIMHTSNDSNIADIVVTMTVLLLVYFHSILSLEILSLEHMK